jgi:antitoxin HigA-1
MSTKRRVAPIHPGEVLKQLIIDASLTQVELARHLGMPAGKLNEICNGKRGISPLMALKLAAAFSQSAELWMDLQRDWELERVDESLYSAITPVESKTAA